MNVFPQSHEAPLAAKGSLPSMGTMTGGMAEGAILPVRVEPIRPAWKIPQQIAKPPSGWINCGEANHRPFRMGRAEDLLSSFVKLRTDAFLLPRNQSF